MHPQLMTLNEVKELVVASCERPQSQSHSQYWYVLPVFDRRMPRLAITRRRPKRLPIRFFFGSRILQPQLLTLPRVSRDPMIVGVSPQSH